MAWHWPGDKPLSEGMLAWFMPDSSWRSSRAIGWGGTDLVTSPISRLCWPGSCLPQPGGVQEPLGGGYWPGDKPQICRHVGLVHASLSMEEFRSHWVGGTDLVTSPIWRLCWPGSCLPQHGGVQEPLGGGYWPGDKPYLKAVLAWFMPHSAWRSSGAIGWGVLTWWQAPNLKACWPGSCLTQHGGVQEPLGGATDLEVLLHIIPTGFTGPVNQLNTKYPPHCVQPMVRKYRNR